MNYDIHFIELEILMLHAKLQDPGPFVSRKENFQRFLLFVAMSVNVVM